MSIYSLLLLLFLILFFFHPFFKKKSLVIVMVWGQEVKSGWRGDGTHIVWKEIVKKEEKSSHSLKKEEKRESIKTT